MNAATQTLTQADGRTQRAIKDAENLESKAGWFSAATQFFLGGRLRDNILDAKTTQGLVDTHREGIAKALKMEAEKVGEKHLFQAIGKDKAIKSAVVAARKELPVMTRMGRALTTRANVITAAISTGVDVVMSGVRHKKDMHDLSNTYRLEIAQELGMDPAEVNKKHLKDAAKTNPGLKEAMGVADFTRLSIPITGLSAALGAAALGVATGGIGLVPGLVLGGAGGMAASYVTEKVLRHMADKNPDHGPHQQVKTIIAAREAGQGVTAQDVFGVKVASDKELSKSIQKTYGKHYDDLSAQDKAHVLATQSPEIAQRSAFEAQLINEGARPQGLLFAQGVQPVAAPASFAPPAAEAAGKEQKTTDPKVSDQLSEAQQQEVASIRNQMGNASMTDAGHTHMPAYTQAQTQPPRQQRRV